MTKKSQELPQAELIKLYRNAVARGVPLTEIDEKVTKHVQRLKVTKRIEAVQDTIKTETLKRELPAAVRLGALALPVAFIVFGMFLVGNALFPIVKAYVGSGDTTQVAELKAPVPREDVMEVTPLVVTQVAADDGVDLPPAEPKIIDVELDYTNLANWFDSSMADGLQDESVAEDRPAVFTIDIPKLDIVDAEVAVGGSDLNESLIQYPGTALPGEYGAPVVFGHSVLRQFYNPSVKNPRRYNSIFSTIMTLQKGDEIYVTYDGIKYTYVVQEKTEVKPTDVYILAQQYDARRLKLVTCTPEGTYLRRGVITAELISRQ